MRKTAKVTKCVLKTMKIELWGQIESGKRKVGAVKNLGDTVDILCSLGQIEVQNLEDLRSESFIYSAT